MFITQTKLLSARKLMLTRLLLSGNPAGDSETSSMMIAHAAVEYCGKKILNNLNYDHKLRSLTPGDFKT